MTNEEYVEKKAAIENLSKAISEIAIEMQLSRQDNPNDQARIMSVKYAVMPLFDAFLMRKDQDGQLVTTAPELEVFFIQVGSALGFEFGQMIHDENDIDYSIQLLADNFREGALFSLKATSSVARDMIQ